MQVQLPTKTQDGNVVKVGHYKNFLETLAINEDTTVCHSTHVAKTLRDTSAVILDYEVKKALRRQYIIKKIYGGENH